MLIFHKGIFMFIHRNITKQLLGALATAPIVLLNGARQTGKSTLTQWISKQMNFEYITLDNYTVLDSLKRDPLGFLSNFKNPLVVDEIQRVPDAFLAFKQIIDQDRRSGKFLLTGSANIFMLPKLADSLAGRMEILTLWPFSCDELRGFQTNFIDSLFSKSLFKKSIQQYSFNDLLRTIIAGGYPEIQKLKSDERRNSWFNSYITTILQRDIRDFSRIEGIQELPRLLMLLASRSGSLLNMSNVSRDSGLVLMTLKRYVSLLEATFLVKRLPAWFTNIGKRLVKMPKIYLTDTGLLCHLLDADQNRLRRDPMMLGKVLENFVMQELFKQAEWSKIRPRVYFYRSAAGKEVDFILENRGGQIVAIEVKSSTGVDSKDLKGLIELREALGERFIRGIVIYTGQEIIPLGTKLQAMPVQALWRRDDKK